MASYIKEDNQWKSVVSYRRKVEGEWVTITENEFRSLCQSSYFKFGGTIIPELTISIGGPASFEGVNYFYSAILSDGTDVTTASTWSLTSGQEYATMNSSTGELIISTGASASTVTVAVRYHNLTDSKTTVITYKTGSTGHTETEIDIDESGNTTTTTTTVVENEDGSSTVETSVVHTDDSGNTTGSQETVTNNNSDGSYESTTTVYDENGTATEGTNVSGDTGGSVSTQEIEYDESGNTAVTSYSVDTTDNPDGYKSYNADGVNTEYYAFDLTEGFVVDFHFTIDFSNQPAGQDENHHNILTAKRANPSPWYGFQLRHSSTNKNIILGTQFATGNNTNTTINPMSSTGNTGEYNIKIIYDPTASTNKFRCINANTGTNLYTNNGTFPDIPELEYIKVTIGYAMDPNGDPYRYSNVNVINFNIRKLGRVTSPAIHFDGEYATITCTTEGVTIYYALNQSEAYAAYSNPIHITAETIVKAYAELDERKSPVVTRTCTPAKSIANPVIYCDGENVTITCETSGAVIYYRINQLGEYEVYDSGFSITADTIVEAYAEADGETSNTIVETCIYNPDHDYSKDYLTFDVLTGGTIAWQSFGAGYSRTIEYSVNGGAWTSITSSSAPPTINVQVGDKVRVRGTNTTYAGSNANYSGFGGGTAVFDIEGNIMSLIYGDNFVNQNTLSGTYNFCSLFKLTNTISAENLILPATTLTPHCYRAMFAQAYILEAAPALPATTLANSCYRYMFQDAAITTAPDLLATVLVQECYEGMFNNCLKLEYIKCLARDISAASATTAWVTYIKTYGTFVQYANVPWEAGANGIPVRWTVVKEGLSNPDIICDGLNVTITCETQGSSIYYRLNEAGTFGLYSLPIPITADTIVEAYSVYSGETSSTVSANCIYDDGIEEPVIYCDGEYITISCDTGGASIYYRLNQTGTYTQYESAIVITADTICESYSEIDGRQSEVVSANCIYDESLKAPVIECDGVEITITCRTAGADIYYRLDQEGTYDLYDEPFSITADTVVEAYSQLSGETSAVVTKNCTYDPTHDYSKDYLTLRVLSNGTIGWNSVGSGSAKTVQYSKNNGTWTSITASSTMSIPVVVGDVVRFKGTNTRYCEGSKNNYSSFGSTEGGVGGGTAQFNAEGNVMSLVYGDNFDGQTTLTSTYNFCQLFKCSHCVSAENLVLPTMTLTQYCYRAMFSRCGDLIKVPALPATTLASGCYWYMFEQSPSFTDAPELPAETLVAECYGHMFEACTSLNYIKCMAISGFTASKCKENWVLSVASSGTFVKDASVSVSTWTRGNSGIPTNWLVYDDVSVSAPEVTCDTNNVVTITCDTQGATIYYKTTTTTGDTYTVYTTPFTISEDTIVEAYAELDGQESRVVSQTCEYISDDPYEYSNRDLSKWKYNGSEITTPYSVNKDDGHSSSYAKGTFNFEASFALKAQEPTYLWFQHADQSATVYIDNVQVEKHWGGYSAFFVDISNFVHSGSNTVKVALKNNEGNYLAPAAGDFNFNATLGNVKLFTSPYLPAMNYGYDGFHVQATASTSSATIKVMTSVPTGATVVCTIDDGTYHFSDSASSTNSEMVFTANITNPHLWSGTLDPHLYTITMEIYADGDLYHRYVRPYGLRFYEYVINQTVNGDTYTGFLLNGQPYLLRGCCMHDDIDGKANALNDADYTTTFATIQELGLNFLRLAHYPHPKETYDWCDRLGIIVQTEGPCVNKMQSTMPTDYYDHLNTQYDDMVNQHYNHPCIVFWGLSNETTTDDKEFAKTKINGYIARIRALDNSRLIGYVMAQGPGSDPSAYYNNPDADWFGCNIYDGWYTSQNSNNPTSSLNTRVKNVITNKSKILCYSEYGCGGTQRCHSDNFMTTTTRGNNPRHDIEYMMWLHEGEIAAIKNFPQLAFTAQWQLFDIAVANRNEGYIVCLDGENTSEDDSLRRLNNKGLVERDHVTKKDPFYLYKAWWNTTDKFVHICCKEYTKTAGRVIKCYTNDGSSLDLYVNNTKVETVTVTDHIAEFTAANYSSGDVIRVEGSTTNDTLTFS